MIKYGAAVFLGIIFCLGVIFSQDMPVRIAENLYLVKVGVFPCGKEPKQVVFSPDNRYIFLPLLNDKGVDIFSVAEKKVITRLSTATADKLGYTEGLFIPEKHAFFVSQMTDNSIHEFQYPELTYKRTIATQGEWSKFMAWNKEKNIVAVSNWVSNNLSLIDYTTGEVLRLIKTQAAPRGIIFTDKGQSIISLAFDGGAIEKFSVSTGQLLASIHIEKAAMRHIVLDDDETTAYISDMFHKSIYQVDLETFSITNTTKVYTNPNTIDLLDNRWLFVSSRGPNNPIDYTLPSPVNGKISVIDTSTMETVVSFEGGNQPAGLDISDDGKFFCFSNFQDGNIQLYRCMTKAQLRNIKKYAVMLE